MKAVKSYVEHLATDKWHLMVPFETIGLTKLPLKVRSGRFESLGEGHLKIFGIGNIDRLSTGMPQICLPTL